MRFADYYTTWSCAWFMGSLVLLLAMYMSRHEHPVLVACIDASMINMLTVQAIGPLVLAFGRVPSSYKAQLLCNAYMHCMPGTIAMLLAFKRGVRSSFQECLRILLVFKVLYLLHGDTDVSHTFDKISNAYGIRQPLCWSFVILAFNIGLLHQLSRSV